MVNKAINDLVRGASLYRVWLHQAYHEISAKYKRTVLGSLWISGAMVATSLALAIVMGGIQNQNLSEVLPYVMAGIMTFALSGFILNEAPEAYMASAHIIKNHPYPYTYYSFEGITRVFLIFLHNIVAFYICLAILGKLTFPHPTLIIALPCIYINSLIWGNMASMFAARFRDVRFLLPFVSQIIFFLTPIFWRPDTISGWRKGIVEFNPFYGLVEVVRSPLLGKPVPLLAWEHVGISMLVGITLWLIFFSVFRKKIAFWI